MKLVLALLATTLAFGQTNWSPAHSMKFRTVSDVAPSPDGKHVAWSETWAVIEEEKSEMRTHIFAAGMDGTGRVQLTRGEKSAKEPKWSPDGRWVYFSSDRSGKPNLYRIAIEGGEAEQLTDWKGTGSAFAPSPDGKWVAWIAAEEDKDLEKSRKQKADWKVVEADPKNQSLWLVPLGGELPAKPQRLTDAKIHVMDFRWSPDSSRIAYVHTPESGLNEAYRSDVSEIEIANKQARVIAGTEFPETEPQYSPDGRYLAFRRAAGKRMGVDAHRVILLTRASGEQRPLAETHDGEPKLLGWTRAGLLFLESRGTKGGLQLLPLDAPPRDVLLPQRGILNAWAPTATHIGVSLQSPEEPVEAYVLPLEGRPAPVRVSAANVGVARPALGKTEVVRWKSKDGREIEGLLTYPREYKAGTRVPLLLNIHGGPSGVFAETFTGASGIYPIASFAEKGIAVLRPNPRGSAGYGAAVRQMVVQDWGGLDAQDLLSGVDHVIGMGVANPDKLAVMGWSYGGYMTAWLVTQTTRFKAAAVGAGITNTVSMYGTQDIPKVFEDYFGGTPWELPNIYAKSSPMEFVGRVKTPTLILHGEADPRVPVTQGYEFHRALKRQGVPVEMVVYPRMPHGPNEPKFTQNIAERHLAWAEKWLLR